MRIKFLIISVIFFGACQKSDLQVGNEISLKSPSGIYIASDIGELKQIVATQLQLGSNTTGIKILKISYLPVETGFAALIDYSHGGNQGNLAYADYNKIRYESSSLTVSNPSGRMQENISDDDGGKVTVTCSGTCDCRAQGTISPDGTITFGCSCSACTATITY